MCVCVCRCVCVGRCQGRGVYVCVCVCVCVCGWEWGVEGGGILDLPEELPLHESDTVIILSRDIPVTFSSVSTVGLMVDDLHGVQVIM